MKKFIKKKEEKSMIKNQCKKGLSLLLVLLLMMSCMMMPAFATGTIEIDLKSPANIYDGKVREDNLVHLYDGSYYSYVEYEIEVAETGLYQLDASVAVSADKTAQFKIYVDGVEVEGIFDVAPKSVAWEIRETMLHDSIPLVAGTRTLKIEQAELTSATLFYSLDLTKVGEYAPPAIINVDVLSPANIYDGIKRENDVNLYGNNATYSWVEYEIEVEKTALYQLDAQIGVSADKLAQFKIFVDGVEVEGICNVAPDSGSYTKRTATLHDSIPLAEGKRTLRIQQAELLAASLIYSLTLSESGEYVPPAVIDIDALSPSNIYDGTTRASDVNLYGNNATYSWVEYEIEVEKTALYQLDAEIGVSANDTAQFKIFVDGVEVDEIFDVAPDSGSYTKRAATLHDSIPLAEGTRTLRIQQAELVAASLIYSLSLKEVGEYVPPVVIDLDTLSPANKYDGEIRSDSICLNGNNANYSWVEYEIDVEKTALYQLDAEIGVSANATAQFKIFVDGVEVDEIFDVAPDSGSYTKRTATLHDSIPLAEGTRTLRIQQAELVATSLIYSLKLSESGEYVPPATIDIDTLSPANIYDGTIRENDVNLYGNNATYSYVEYEIEVEKTALYQLDAEIGVSANATAQFKIFVDGVEVDEIFDVAPDSGSYTKRAATLHDSIPLAEGTRTLRIQQAELVAASLIYSLSLKEVGEYVPPVVIDLDTLSPANKYDGEIRSDSICLNGNNANYSWVEYEIDVEKTALYQLDALIAVSAEKTAQFKILVDGVEVDEIFDVAPDSGSYTKRTATLHDSIPLAEGTRTLRIQQAELVATSLIYSLTLKEVGEYVESTTIDIDALSAVDKYDGETRSDCICLNGNNANYSWVEYEIEVEKTALYKLNALIAVSADKTAQFKILVDGVEVDGIFDVAPDSGSYTKRTATLHDSIPLAAGTRTLRIQQAELEAASLIYSLSLKEVGEYVAPTIINIDALSPVTGKYYDGKINADNFQFYGGNQLYSWVEYEVNVEKSGIYQLDALIGVTADATAQFKIFVDVAAVEGILDIAPNSGSYTKRTATLHDSIPLAAGKRRIRIQQAELTSTVQLYSLKLTKVGEYEAPAVSDVLEVFNSDGERVETVTAGTYTAKANFFGENKNVNANLYIAIYTEVNGKAKLVSTDIVSRYNGEEYIDANISVKAGEMVKVFLWNYGNYIPLCEALNLLSAIN